jgi:RHS repeat-associated protein
LNRDGRTDRLVTAPGELQSLVNTQDDALVHMRVPPLPAGTVLEDSDVDLLEFNGDGILDLVRYRFSPESSVMEVSFGTGHGRYTRAFAVSSLPRGPPEEFHLHDVNYDGQTDILRLSGPSIYYHLNSGDLRFLDARGPFRGLAPSDVQQTLFADMNGNGTSDVVWVTRNDELHYLDLRKDATPGLLTRIDNGMGMVMEMAYQASTDFLLQDKNRGEPWTTPLPNPVPVVVEAVTRDSFHLVGLAEQQVRTTFTYHNGYFDGHEREFRGFARVTETAHGDNNHPTAVSEYGIHVGRNLETGEDEEVLKGKTHSQWTRDTAGTLYASTETHWQRQWLCDGDVASPFQIAPRCEDFLADESAKDHLLEVAYAEGTLKGAWEGTSTPRWTYARALIDAWGRPWRAENYGEVGVGARQPGDPWDPSAFALNVGNDEVVDETTYVDNLGEWLLGLPRESRTLSIRGEELAKTRTYYDGPAFVGLPLAEVVRGVPTRQSAWLKDLDGTTRWIDTSRVEIDGHGNVIAKKNALDFLTRFEFDPETSTFPVAEHLYVGAHVPGGRLTQRQGVDRGYGHPLTSTNFNGNGSAFSYDGLARLTAIVGPLDSVSQPLARFAYEYGSRERPLSTTLAWQLRDRERGIYVSAWTYSDGLGRARATQAEAEAPHGFLSGGWMEYSARGSEVASYKPYSAGRGFSPPPRGTPSTRQVFDLMSRPIRSYWPDEDSYQEFQYLPLESRRYDEANTAGAKLYPRISHYNGRGQVVRQEVYNQVDGRVDVLRWRAVYDPLDRITEFYDPEGNPRVYQYDSLGRLRQLLDPNAGQQRNTFNDLGLALTHTNAVGETLQSAYHPSGRPLTTLFRDARGGEQSSYCYHYDVPVLGQGGTNLLGNLSAITGPVSIYQASYDVHQRIDSESRAIWDPATSSASEKKHSVFRKRFHYDASGNVLRWELPGGVQGSSRINTRGLTESLTLTRGTSAWPIVTAASYDALGLPERQVLGDNTGACMQYDDRLRLTETRVTTGPSCTGTVIQQLRLGYTVNNLISSVDDLGPRGLPSLGRRYEYDPALQLRRAIDPAGNMALDFRYDRIQNMTERRTSRGEAVIAGRFSYGRQGGGGSNLLTKVNDQRVQQDAAGRLRSIAGHRFYYDAGDRLVRVQAPDGARVDYYHDAGDTRLLTVTTTPDRKSHVEQQGFADYWRHDGRSTWRVGSVVGAAELTERAVLPNIRMVDEQVQADRGAPFRPWPRTSARELLRALARERELLPPAPRLRFYHPDVGGTPVQVTEADGSLSFVETRYPFGAIRDRLGDPPLAGFTGSTQRVSSLEMVKLGARVYLPQYARWLTPDPKFVGSPGGLLAAPMQSNLLGYVANSPISFVDPTGTEGEEAKFDPSSVKQKGLGSCAVLAVLIALETQRPGATLASSFGDGRMEVVLYGGDHFEGLELNTIYSGTPTDLRHASSNNGLAAAVEAAVYQTRGGLPFFLFSGKGYTLHEPIRLLTGHASYGTISHPAIQQALREKRVVTATRLDDKKNGIVGVHAYAVIGFDPKQREYILVNPWGYFEPKRYVSIPSGPERFAPKLSAVRDTADDGRFTVPEAELTETFPYITVESDR